MCNKIGDLSLVYALHHMTSINYCYGVLHLHGSMRIYFSHLSGVRFTLWNNISTDAECRVGLSAELLVCFITLISLTLISFLIDFFVRSID